MKPRICFITSSTQIGGAEKQLLEVIGNLRDVCQISIIILDATGPLLETYKSQGVKTYILPSKDKFSSFLQACRMINILKESQPDCVQTWLYQADILGGLAAKISGVPRINWSARNTALPHFSLWKRFILRILAKFLPTTIVANSSQAGKYHRSLGYPAKKISVIPNYLPKWSKTVTSNSRLLTQPPPVWPLDLGVAARITKGKGLIELVKGIAACRSNQMLVTLSILGAPGNLYQELQRKVMDLGLKDHVHFANPTQDVADWFSAIDLYVMSSTHWESHPNSLAEALAIGCPVILSDSISSVIDWHIEGPVYSPKDPQTLISAIDTIQVLGSLRVQEISAHNRAQVEQLSSSEEITLLWKQCFFDELK